MKLSLLFYYIPAVGNCVLLAALRFLHFFVYGKAEFPVRGASLTEEVLEDLARTIAREHSAATKYYAPNWADSSG
jgi:hypothetical protein